MPLHRRFITPFKKLAIPNITGYLIAFQVLCMLLIWMKPEFAGKLLLVPADVLHGEWWRLITFLFMPPSLNPLWAAFILYFYWLMGNALEAHWGTARYNLYLLIAAVMSIVASLIPAIAGISAGVGTNIYIWESVFLAFAALWPDFVILLFFILPVRVKWLAWLTWLVLAFQYFTGGWIDKAMVLAAVANFLLFFWRDIADHMRRGRKRVRKQLAGTRIAAPTDDAMHRCTICNATEKTHPHYEFRYCSDCGGKCYCMDHLRSHTHIQSS